MIKCYLTRDDVHIFKTLSGTISQIMKKCRGFGGSYDLYMFCISPGGEYFWTVYRLDDDTGQLYEYQSPTEFYPINMFTVNMDYAKYVERLDALTQKGGIKA